MWKPNLKRRRYKILGWTSLLFAMLVFLVLTIGWEIIFMEKTIANNKAIVLNKDVAINERIAALQYLVNRRVSLAGFDFSGEKNLLRGLDFNPKTLGRRDGIDLRNAHLAHADLSGINLSEANLSGANLSAANLSDARLHNVNLSNANLSEANLYKTNLSGANLSKAMLIGANLFATGLTAANLSAADLSDANIFAASLTSANLTNVIFNNKTTIDSIWIWDNTMGHQSENFLPVGTPKNWNTTLKPEFVCSEVYTLIDANLSKGKIKRRIKRKCDSYAEES